MAAMAAVKAMEVACVFSAETRTEEARKDLDGWMHSFPREKRKSSQGTPGKKKVSWGTQTIAGCLWEKERKKGLRKDTEKNTGLVFFFFFN